MASVEKDPTRRRTPYVVRWRDETGRQRKRGFARKADADRFRAEVEHQLNSGTYVDHAAGAITFSAFFAEWSARQVWAPGTERAARLAAGSATFGGVALRQLRRSHIEAWVKAMQSRGLAPGTIRTRYRYVRMALRAAVRDRLIGADPAEGVKLPRQRRAEAAMVLPTTAQVRALMDAADPSLRAFIALCAFAGLRSGEAGAVKVSDVDFLRRTLTVARQVQYDREGRPEIRPPKYGSERVVYLAPGLVDILAEQVRRAAPDGWLFPAADGGPAHHGAVRFRWVAACRKAGVTGVRMHDLRHFYASGLIAAGCDVVTVQRAMGHASATVTLETYSHLWPSAEDRTRKAAAALLAETLGADVPTLRPNVAR